MARASAVEPLLERDELDEGSGTEDAEADAGQGAAAGPGLLPTPIKGVLAGETAGGEASAPEAAAFYGELGIVVDQLVETSASEWASGVCDFCDVPFKRCLYAMWCPCCMFADVAVRAPGYNSCGWYGNCITYCGVRLLSIPLDFIHLRSLPSPLTGCLLSSLRSHVRRSHNLREEACNESCSPCCGLSNDCCASWCCRWCVLIQLANQMDAAELENDANDPSVDLASTSPPRAQNSIYYAHLAADPPPLVYVKAVGRQVGFKWN